MKFKHPNYDIIVAWANGEEIEYSINGIYWTGYDQNIIIGDDNFKWRIKPQPIKVRYKLAVMRHIHSGDYTVTSYIYSDKEYVQNYLKYVEESVGFVKWIGDVHEVEIEK